VPPAYILTDKELTPSADSIYELLLGSGFNKGALATPGLKGAL
jgi:hypothetical protein